MKVLENSELHFVSGGTGSPTAPTHLRVCNSNNLPDSAKVTIKVTNQGGADGFLSSAEAVAVEMTCGEARAEARSGKGG